MNKAPAPKPVLKDKHQVVAGFIVYMKTTDGVKFLLLYRRGGYWNFPKGHFEQGENALKTALRETEEETGLKPADLRIIPEFRTYVKFHFTHANRKIFDTVILHLAETKNPHIVVSPREHSGYAWFTYKDAIKILGHYVGTKRALKEAFDFIHQKSIRHREGHPARHSSAGTQKSATPATSAAPRVSRARDFSAQMDISESTDISGQSRIQ